MADVSEHSVIFQASVVVVLTEDEAQVSRRDA